MAWLEKGVSVPRWSGIRHACHGPFAWIDEEGPVFVAAIMTGIDLHKGSHSAVAVSADERQVGSSQPTSPIPCA